MASLTLTCTDSQPIVGKTIGHFTVSISGLASGYKTAYLVLYDKNPAFAFDIGLGVSSLVSWHGGPLAMTGYFVFGPGTYNLYARLNVWDSGGSYSATDSALIEVVVQ